MEKRCETWEHTLLSWSPQSTRSFEVCGWTLFCIKKRRCYHPFPTHSPAMIVTAHDPCYFSPLPDPPCSQGLESMTFKPPPLDGSIPLPELYDWQYRHSPDHPVFLFDDPSSSKPNDIRAYSWKTVVPVIHRTGRHILSLFNLTLPLDPENIPVIAVLAAAGIRSPIWSKT